MYTWRFDKNNPNWTSNPQLNLYYLKAVQRHFNDKLRTNGYVFLSDILEYLGEKTKPKYSDAGWVCSGDSYIDFGIYDRTSEAMDFVNGVTPDATLVFNVDGNIADYIIDSALHHGGPERVRDFFETPGEFMNYIMEEI